MNNNPDPFRLPRPLSCFLAVIGVFVLAACGQSESTPLARIELARIEPERIIAAPMVMASPDTSEAEWIETPQTLDFVNAARAPLLSLACELGTAAMPRMRIIRHAPAETDSTAIMALIGNGRISRLKAQAVRMDAGLHWEAILPAKAPELDVFAGIGAVETTLPGAGTLTSARSELPRQLLENCRAGAQPG